MECLPAQFRARFEGDFCLAHAVYYAGRVATTAKNRPTHLDNWTSYVQPLGKDPHLQGVSYIHRVRVLTRFAARVRQGCYGCRRHIQACTVSSALTAIGQEIPLACELNPTKVNGLDKIIPQLQQMYDGWRKADPPTSKMLPMEADVPEFLADVGNGARATELDRAVGDLALVAFYYLLRVGEYTIKGCCNGMKQTVQFKKEDITFFKKNLQGQLRCLPRDAPEHIIMLADEATLKLDNQKNGWKGVCVYQEHNGKAYNCPVRALGQRYRHLQQHSSAEAKTYLSAHWVDGIWFDVTAEDMSQALKQAAMTLEYPVTKGIPVERINTHSLRSGGGKCTGFVSIFGHADTKDGTMARGYI